MEKTIHYIPIGHTKKTLLESLRRHPVSKIFLVLGENKHAKGEQKAKKQQKK